jgi:hypothetical protein
MADVSTKEQAENYVFSNNATQIRVYNKFNLFMIAVVGLLFAALAFLIGYGDKDFALEVIAFVAASVAVIGFIFAIVETETHEKAIQNTFLTQAGFSVQVESFVFTLVATGAHAWSPDLHAAFYLIPLGIYVVIFVLTFLILHGRLGTRKQSPARTKSLAYVGGFTLIAILIAGFFSFEANGALNSLSGSGHGYLLIILGGVVGFFLGLLTGISWFRDLLVKKYDIDLSKLYEINQI